MANAETVSTVAPVTSRAETIARLRAHEAEIRALGATALYLFGSAARDELGPESDVDLFIDYVRDPTTFDYFKLCRMEDLVASTLAREIDLLTRYGIHPMLKDDIEASSVRVF